MMGGEGAFLTRSFSHPSTASREAKEGDLYRALTESVSFGRFMSEESLNWEKWSAFTRNRYLEEVERFAKPGSVAQKKAFFEAHYKKRAAVKAASLLGEGNATMESVAEEKIEMDNHVHSPSNLVSEESSGSLVSTWPHESHSDKLQYVRREEKENPYCSPIQSEPVEAISAAISNDECKEEIFGHDIIDTVLANEYSKDQRGNLQNPIVEACGEIMEPLEHSKFGKKTTGDIDSKEHKKEISDGDIALSLNSYTYANDQWDDLQNQRVERCVEITEPVEHSDSGKQTTCEIGNEESEDKIADVNIAHSVDLDRYPGTLRENSHDVFKKTYKATSEQSTGVENPARIESSKLLKSSIYQDKTASMLEIKASDKVAMKKNVGIQGNKRQISSSLKSPTENRESKLPKPSAKQASRLMQQNGGRFAASSCKKPAEELKDKRICASRSMHMSIDFATKACSKPELTTRRSPIQAFAKKAQKFLPCANHQPAVTRKKPFVNQSISSGLKGDRILQALSGDTLNSSSNGGNKMRSRITSSPFSLKSEERAAKRKEFFQKLEEEKKAKEAEKIQPILKPKEKSALESKRIRQSTCFGAKANEFLNHGRKSPNELEKKIPPIQSQSSKLGRKPAAVAAPSVIKQQKTVDNSPSSKRVVSKNTQSVTRSVMSLPKKKSPENLSPNILH